MSPRWLCPGTAHLSSAAVLLELLCIPNCFWRSWSGLLCLNDKQPQGLNDKQRAFIVILLKTLEEIWLIHLKANSKGFRLFVKGSACFQITLAVWLLGFFPFF